MQNLFSKFRHFFRVSDEVQSRKPHHNFFLRFAFHFASTSNRVSLIQMKILRKQRDIFFIACLSKQTEKFAFRSSSLSVIAVVQQNQEASLYVMNFSEELIKFFSRSDSNVVLIRKLFTENFDALTSRLVVVGFHEKKGRP